jgi:hypothetical protein
LCHGLGVSPPSVSAARYLGAGLPRVPTTSPAGAGTLRCLPFARSGHVVRVPRRHPPQPASALRIIFHRGRRRNRSHQDWRSHHGRLAYPRPAMQAAQRRSWPRAAPPAALSVSVGSVLHATPAATTRVARPAEVSRTPRRFGSSAASGVAVMESRDSLGQAARGPSANQRVIARAIPLPAGGWRGWRRRAGGAEDLVDQLPRSSARQAQRRLAPTQRSSLRMPMPLRVDPGGGSSPPRHGRVAACATLRTPTRAPSPSSVICPHAAPK